MEKNKGFTLVELLVTFAILSIVLAGVTSVMVAGSKSFSKGNADANMQNQAQLVVNQIEDMVIDTNGGVYYEKDDTTNDREFTLYNAYDAEVGSGTTYTKEVVKWVAAEEKLYYSRWNVTYDASSGTYETIDPAEVSDALLAEEINDFSVDLSDTRKEYSKNGEAVQIVQSVQITAGYIGNKGQVSYATSPVITLRNRMMLSGSPKVIFDNTPVSPDTLKLYISDAATSRTPIVDRVTEVTRGNGYNIYAMINAENDVNSLVEWKIEETGSTSSIDDQGILSVGDKEVNAYLTIVATYKNNPGKYAKGVVKVVGGNLKSLDAVHITTKSLVAFNPQFGSVVDTTDFTEEELSRLQYTWTLSKDCADFNGGYQKDSVNIKIRDGFYDQVITVTVSVYSPDTNQTVSDSTPYHIDQKGSSGEGYVERGNEGTGFDVWYSYEGLYGNPKMTLEYFFCDEFGNKTADSDALLKYIAVTDQNKTFHFRVLPGLPANRGYYVKARETYEATDAHGSPKNFVYERIFQVGKVQILGQITHNTQTQPGNYQELRYVMSGYNQQAWMRNKPVKYEVQEIIYDAPDGVTVEPTFFGNLVTAGTDNTMVQTVSFTVKGGAAWQVEMKSLKVKVIFTDAPEIFAYSTILFGTQE